MDPSYRKVFLLTFSVWTVAKCYLLEILNKNNTNQCFFIFIMFSTNKPTTLYTYTHIQIQIQTFTHEQNLQYLLLYVLHPSHLTLTTATILIIMLSIESNLLVMVNILQYSGISLKRTLWVQNFCPSYKDVCFVETPFDRFYFLALYINLQEQLSIL